MLLCLSLEVLTGCRKKQNDISTGAKPQPAVGSTARSSPATPSAPSADTALRAKASEQRPSVQSSAPPQYPTLAQVLAAAGLKPPPDAVNDLDQSITSYAALLDDRDAYLIAYYRNLPSGMLEDPLRVLSFDRHTAEWNSAQLILGSDQIGHSECVGSVLGVHVVPSAFLLDTHINPSAGCLVILDRSLAFKNALYGWYLAALEDTQIIFQRSEVHFAAVHPAELGLYDLTTNNETSLFPRKPFQRIRADYAAKLQEFYRAHEEWCREHNDPCDAENVDSDVSNEIAVNAGEHALAFLVSYRGMRNPGESVQKPQGPGEVVYVYRDVNNESKLDYREMLLSDVEKRFGKVPLRSLLEPAALQEIFDGTVRN
jgi:hypothetical protein